MIVLARCACVSADRLETEAVRRQPGGSGDKPGSWKLCKSNLDRHPNTTKNDATIPNASWLFVVHLDGKLTQKRARQSLTMSAGSYGPMEGPQVPK